MLAFFCTFKFIKKNALHSFPLKKREKNHLTALNMTCTIYIYKVYTILYVSMSIASAE